MQILRLKNFFLGVILLAVLNLAHQCPRATVRIGENCVYCKTLENVRVDDVNEYTPENWCPCIRGYLWSEALMRCVNRGLSKRNILFNAESFEPSWSTGIRSLQSDSCRMDLGMFTNENNLCISCRSYNYAMALVLTNQSCTCTPGFSFQDGRCQCGGQKYINTYGLCDSCYGLPPTFTASQLQDCIFCNNTFIRGDNGCVYCLHLENNGGNTSCCAPGFYFNGQMTKCYCDHDAGYAVNSQGVCTKCPNKDKNCYNCVNNYVNNGFYCLHGSNLPNFDYSSTYTCKPGYVFKRDPYKDQIISCVCSSQKDYYLNGDQCIACSTTLPKSVSLSNCKYCSTSAGFYQGTAECIYCPGVAYSTGTATASGCDCQTNYFWNSNTDKCECDYMLGFAGGAIDECIYCPDVEFASKYVSQTGLYCICLQGFVWNSDGNYCECDSSSPYVFNYGGQCFDCAIMTGSTKLVGADGKSCVCLDAYFWNYATHQCQCNSQKNYVTFKYGVCTDCSNSALANGLAYANRCACTHNLVWRAKSATCVCPAGYVMIGATCTNCNSITLPDGSTVDDCNSCNSAKGFANQNGYCGLCSTQNGVVSNSADDGNCQCPSGQNWSPLFGSCVCDWGYNFVTYINADGSFKCIQCPYRNQDDACTCNDYPLRLSALSNICSNRIQDPNFLDQTQQCKEGYGWSEMSYPFKCVRAYSGGSYMSLGDSPSQAHCSEIDQGLQDGCFNCDSKFGFVVLYGMNKCLYCASVNEATGKASPTGCECNSGFHWNSVLLSCDQGDDCAQGLIYNPLSQVCDICDPVHSFLKGTNCVSCKADQNSIGFIDSSSSCACKESFTWASSDSGGSCVSGDCNTDTSVWIGSTCFKCPSENHGEGKVVDGDCSCLDGYSWQVKNGEGSCVCNLDTSIVLASGQCFACPSNDNSSGDVDGQGGCVCLNNYVWSEKSKNCICDSSVSGYVSSSGTCFQCLNINDPNFDGTFVADKCNCINGYTFVETSSGGNCVCNSPSLELPTGYCATCPINSNTTGSFDAKGVCECNVNYFWSDAKQTCLCDSSISAYKTSSGACFQCLPTNDPNFDGTIVKGVCNCKNGWSFISTAYGGSCACNPPKVIQNGVCTGCPVNENTTGVTDGSNGCVCNNKYIWDGKVTKSCICDATVSAVILVNGNCFQCLISNDPNFDGTVVNDACHCANSFTPSFNTTTGFPNCICKSNVSSTGICYTCPNNAVPDKNGVCACANGYSWDSIALACICNPTTSIMAANNSTCFICGSNNTFTKSRKNSLACTCTAKELTWNSADLVCDCGSKSAMQVTGNIFKCIPCTSSINAVSKNTPFSCTCNSNGLIWNTITGKCDCGATGILINSTCITCDAGRFAKGPDKGNACSCLSSAMSWSSTYLSCICTSTSSVNFNNSCQACDSTIFAQKGNRLTPFSCKCPPGNVWVANIGCVCTGQDAIIANNGTKSACVICDSTIYSSGPSADYKSCMCLGSLVWSPSTLSCGCASKSVIALQDGRYNCVPCNATNYATTPLVSPTQCTCISTKLKWNAGGFCGCPDPSVQIVKGSGSSLSCFTCDSSILSSGKSSPDSNICECVSSALTFNNGVCDCGPGFAYFQQGSTYTCVNCNNSALYMRGKASSSACACVSPNLAWDTSTGTCRCSDLMKIVVVSGKNYSCSECVGTYTDMPATPSADTCTCKGAGLVFTPSPTGGSCACPKNQVMLPTFTCIQCPGGVPILSPSPYECKCATNSIWNGRLQKCVACGSSDIPNSNSTGGSSLACKCKTGYIWDVMTQTCITPCTANKPSCMSCKFPEAAGNAVALDPSVTINLSGSSTAQGAINGTYTNYATIKNYMCPCVKGYKWNVARLRCYNSILV